MFFMFQRPYLKQVKSMVEEQRKFIQVIVGPRQVGKITMITQLLPQLSIPGLFESADAVFIMNVPGWHRFKNQQDYD